MYANITSGSKIAGAILYNKRKIDEGHARLLGTNRMLGGRDPQHLGMEECLASFAPYLQANRNTDKPVIHISLNPDPRDRLTDEQLLEIAAEYMERMGYGRQPYFVVKHEDIDRAHIHIVSVRVDENGRKISDSNERRKSAAILRKLEKKYKLYRLEKGQRQERPDLKRLEYGKGDTVQQIASTVRAVLSQYRAGSLHELNALLNIYNIRIDQVRGEAGGKEYEGIVYYALNDRGETLGQPIKSSRIGKDVGPAAIRAKLETDAPTVLSLVQRTRTGERIRAAMLANPTRNGFGDALREQNISVLFRQNAQGRIYGVTFVDHGDGVVLNGSRMGKFFSANAFHALFNGTQEERAEVLRALSPRPASEPLQKHTPVQVRPSPANEWGPEQAHRSGFLGALLNDQNDTEEKAEQQQAEAMRRRMIRKGPRIRR